MANQQYVVASYQDGQSEDAYTPYGAVREFFHYTGQEAMLSGGFDGGKGGLVSSCVMTPQGPRTMGELVVGDSVLSVDGSATMVIGVYPQGNKRTYRVTLHDGTSTVVDGEHLWRVGFRGDKRVSSSVNKERPRIKGSGFDDWRTMSTDELMTRRLIWKAGSKKNTRRKYFLPTAGLAQFNKRQLSIDPYVMGVLIAEGGLTGDSVIFTTGDKEIVDEVSKRMVGAEVSCHANGIGYGIIKGDYRQRLEVYGLMGKYSYEKFIPEDYLYSDIQDRIDLLRGLMDGDGTVDKRHGRVSYSTTSKRLSEDIRFLVESLGGYVAGISSRYPSYTYKGKKLRGRLDYRPSICLPVGFMPFGLERKNRYVKGEIEPRRFIDTIEYVGDAETICIEVAHPSRLYLTDHFIVTHNTLGMLQKLNALLWTYPNCHALLVRKTYSSLLSSALVTLYYKVLSHHPDDPDSPIKLYGGSQPKYLMWPNGSMLRISGLDDPQKVLSAEYDFIAVPQAEELDLKDWEQMLSRVNGRAGNSPWPQLMGDCNPDVPLHWIKQRDELVKFEVRHTDNPTIFARDKNGELVLDKHGNPMPTEDGKLRLKALQSMTGLRYKRGYLGLWVGAEGQVYDDFDPKIHLIDPFPIPPDWRKYRAIDFGFVHPFCCQWWAEDEDGRLILYREMYYSHRTVAMHAVGDEVIRGIVDYTGDERITATICDWDAEDRATLEEHGISTIGADKRIQVGIEKMQERLKVQEDGQPRLMIFKDCRVVEEDDELKTAYKPTSTVEEFAGYVWPNVGGKLQRAADERPVKTSDHGLDAARYMVMHLDGGKGGTVRAHRYA